MALRFFLADKRVKWIALGTSFFIAENIILSENRDYIIKLTSEEAYHATYNTFSFSSCLAIIYGYKFRHRNETFAKLPPATISKRLASFGFHAVGLTLLSQVIPPIQLPFASKKTESKGDEECEITRTQEDTAKAEQGVKFRCPFDFGSDYREEEGLTLAQLITRNPLMWGLSLSCFGEVFRSRSAAGITFFAMPALTVLILGAHMESRYRRNIGGSLSPEIDRITSHIPFAAFMSGALPLSLLINKPVSPDVRDDPRLSPYINFDSNNVKWKSTNFFLALALSCLFTLG